MSTEHHTEHGTARHGTALLGGFLFLSLSMGFAPLAEAHVDAGDGVVTLHHNELVSAFQGFVSRISTAEGRAHGVRTPQLSQGVLADVPAEPKGCHGSTFWGHFSDHRRRNEEAKSKVHPIGYTFRTPGSYQNSGDCTTTGSTIQCSLGSNGPFWRVVSSGSTWCGGGGG